MLLHPPNFLAKVYGDLVILDSMNPDSLLHNSPHQPFFRDLNRHAEYLTPCSPLSLRPRTSTRAVSPRSKEMSPRLNNRMAVFT